MGEVNLYRVATWKKLANSLNSNRQKDHEKKFFGEQVEVVLEGAFVTSGR